MKENYTLGLSLRENPRRVIAHEDNQALVAYTEDSLKNYPQKPWIVLCKLDRITN